MVEAISKEVPNKVTTKGSKKPQGKAFADFINDLGKTSAPKKTNAFNNLTSAESTKKDFISASKEAKNNSQNIDSLLRTSYSSDKATKIAESSVNSAPKSEILSNLLRGRNEENLKDKSSPLDMILSRPQATQTKLNQTPEVKNTSIATPKPTQSFTNTPPRAREEAKLPQQNPQDLKDLQDLPKDKVETTLDSAPKAPKVPKIESVLDTNPKLDSAPKLAQNQKESPLDSAPKTTQDSKPAQEKAQNLAQNKPENEAKRNQTLDSAPKAPKVPKIESVPDTNPKLDSAPKLAENQKESPLDSAKKPPLVSNPTQETSQKDSAPKIENTPDSNPALDSAPKAPKNEAQNLPQDIKIPTENKSNLGITNTLKYGAFKAFDALSLLKPSDGKKLSELIKKADELSLNLQSVKYTKMSENKGIFENVKAQNLAQNKPESEAKIQANQALDSAPKQDFPLDSANNENMPKKLDEKNAESKNTEIKNEPKKETPQIKNNEVKNNDLKSAESKMAEPKTEPKLSESKPVESPLKNALETENNDIKPINLKTEKIAESKKEPPLDSIKDSAIKDAPKPAQENAPLTDAQGTSKIANKMFDARETMKNFAYALKQEIQNYKPPLTKITLELQPANLGSVEVSIISQGKNIQIQLNAPQSTLNLFIQNQSDLRTALSQIGYENVAMSFSNGSQMGFSDNSGKWRYESNANKFRNNFGLKSVDDAQDENEVFEIMITNNYA